MYFYFVEIIPKSKLRLEEKLSKSREVKQGMMQEFLTARIRLI